MYKNVYVNICTNIQKLPIVQGLHTLPHHTFCGGIADSVYTVSIKKDLHHE